MVEEITRERYPCSWPKGASKYGELSDREVKGRINSSKVAYADLDGGFRFRYASMTQRGFYPHDRKKANQDQFVICNNVGAKSNHFFGVFDGHGPAGDACALFARENVRKIVQERVRGRDADIESALTDAYEKANRRLKKSPTDDSLSGTTAISLFARGRHLYVANVGDSRAMMGTSEGAIALSHDQTPFSAPERERIKKCGGRIMSADQVDGIVPFHENWDCNLGEELDDDGDPPRVWNQDLEYPGTAFTRSIGDALAETLGVIATPEVREYDVTADDHVLLIASDGIFEFITNTDCVRIALLYSDPLDSCRALVAEAYKRWMKREERTDDITVIVAFVEAPPDAPRKKPAPKPPSPAPVARRPSARIEGPPPPGGFPLRRKSRRGSHDSKLSEPIFYPVEFLHPATKTDGVIYEMEVLEIMHEEVAEESAKQEALVKTKSSKARRGSMAASAAYLKKAVGDARDSAAEAVRRLSTNSTAAASTTSADGAVVP